jgi:hypothetical protein
MKNINRIVFVLVLISIVSLSSCEKDKSSTSSSVTQIVTTGTWRVSYFIESNEDKTGDFSGYTFTFNSNGQLIATLSGANTTGSWGWDDSSSKMNISIGSSKPLSDLTDDWLVVEKTETLIKLKNDNPSKYELLNFSRN